LKQKKNILIVGYPKSGTTWLTRLTAELLHCPSVGFWGESSEAMATEGLYRTSPHNCYQSHHSFQILKKNTKDIFRIIYVLRDPRDIILSGANHFIFGQRYLQLILGVLPKGKLIYYKLNVFLNSTCYTKSYKIRRMIRAILDGDETVSLWCKNAWKQHYPPFWADKEVLFIQYEHLLADTFLEVRKILTFLELERSEGAIKTAIEKQAFQNKKKQFIQQNQLQKADFLRVGNVNYWKRELSVQQQTLLAQELEKELKFFGYDLI